MKACYLTYLGKDKTNSKVCLWDLLAWDAKKFWGKGIKLAIVYIFKLWYRKLPPPPAPRLRVHCVAAQDYTLREACPQETVRKGKHSSLMPPSSPLESYWPPIWLLFSDPGWSPTDQSLPSIAIPTPDFSAPWDFDHLAVISPHHLSSWLAPQTF